MGRGLTAVDLEKMTLETKLALIRVIAGKFALDEHLGDTTERFETLLFIMTNGKKGYDWGIR